MNVVGKGPEKHIGLAQVGARLEDVEEKEFPVCMEIGTWVSPQLFNAGGP